jgi:predicted enzyme related to lactoylglutathione lyase
MAGQAQTAGNRFYGVAPYLLVQDVVATASFYQDKLGFRCSRFFGEPPQFTIATRGGVSIMLKQTYGTTTMNPNSANDPEDDFWDAYIWVENADALHEEFQSKGVLIVRPICDQEYGCREFTIRDMNGYIIGIGQDLN